MRPVLRLTRLRGPKEHCLAAAGEIDLDSAPKLAHALAEELRRCDDPRLHLDLSAVTFIDSSGLSALVRAQQLAQTCQVELVLTVPSRASTTFFDIAGVAGLFHLAGPDGKSSLATIPPG